MEDDKDRGHDNDDKPSPTPPKGLPTIPPSFPPGVPPPAPTTGPTLDTSPQAVAEHNADVDRLASLPEVDLRRVLRIGLGPLNAHSKNVTEWMIAAI